MRRSIIITGGAGFIGSHITNFIVNNFRLHDVFVIDDLSSGTRLNLAEFYHKINFVKLDLRDEKKTKKFFKKYSNHFIDGLYLIHLASAAHEGRSFFTPIENMSRNDVAYRNILTEAINYNLQKVILFSSIARYGDGIPPFSEDYTDVNPVDPYGVSKVAMEMLTKVLSKVYGFKYTILIPFNVFGENQCYWDPYRNVFAIWMNLLLQGKQPVIFGDGEQVRAFTYIGNCVKSMVLPLFCSKTDNQEINIGSERYITINEAYSIIKEITKVNIDPVYVDGRVSEVKEAYCDITKSKELLEYEEKISFEEGIERMWFWIKMMGPRKFKYIKNFEIESEHIPEPWKKKWF